MMKNIVDRKISYIINLIMDISNKTSTITDLDIYDSDVEILDEIIQNLLEIKNRFEIKTINVKEDWYLPKI